ncbi:AMP-binding protein [Burkholderia sp. TSV86]|nr:AMP-binding protein [Burkholderia sp. TSV86]
MPSNFAEHISNQVIRCGSGKHYVFMHGKPGDPVGEERLGYHELDRRARSIAAWLSACGANSRPVLLAYPEGLAFLQAFVACLYAGVIAVPVPFPGDARSVERTKRIMRDAGIRLVLSASAEQANRLARCLDDPNIEVSFHCAATDTVEDAGASAWQMPDIGLSSIAFLQYTSGSTGEPKGVAVTHRNLLHNEAQIQRAVASSTDSVVTGWLPHFHDMGLIGMLLHPLYVGCDCAFMAPSTFLRRPVRWLEAVTHYAATITVAPNFAYDLCTRAIRDEQLAGLDLSTLKVALNGAEPVRARTIEAFSARFAAVGFASSAFAPCYGMAEITLLATVNHVATPPVLLDIDAGSLERNEATPARADDPARRVVSSGRVVDLDLRIVDPQTREVLMGGRIGEIWLRGDSVAHGYWGHTDINDATFRAETATGEGPYLRTGDLGFVLDGELFVTGRLKDLLIVNGRNLYPQDIEHFIRELHPALGAGMGAVFAVEADGERVVIVHEIKETLVAEGLSTADLSVHIKAAVAREFDIAAPSVVLVPRGAVTRTTSGKVQRGLMRERFLTRRLPALQEDIQVQVRQRLSSEGGEVAHASPQSTALA